MIVADDSVAVSAVDMTMEFAAGMEVEPAVGAADSKTARSDNCSCQIYMISIRRQLSKSIADLHHAHLCAVEIVIATTSRIFEDVLSQEVSSHLDSWERMRRRLSCDPYLQSQGIRDMGSSKEEEEEPLDRHLQYSTEVAC